MKKHLVILAFILSLVSTSLSAQGNIEVRLYKAPIRSGAGVVKTIEAKKASVEKITKGLDSLTRSKKINLLLRTETPIEDEKLVGEKKVTGEFLDPVSKFTKELGYKLKYKTYIEDAQSEVRVDVELTYKEKRDERSFTEKALNLSHTIEDQDWHVLGYWREKFEIVFLLGRGVGNQKPFYVEPANRNVGCKLGLYEVEKLDFEKFQKASAGFATDASLLAKRGTFVMGTMLNSNKDEQVTSSDEYRMSAKMGDSSKTFSYGLVCTGKIQPAVDGEVDYKLKVVWSRPPVKGQLNKLSFDLEKKIKAQESYVIPVVEKSKDGKMKVLILWDKTPLTK